MTDLSIMLRRYYAITLLRVAITLQLPRYYASTMADSAS